jgi:hypothetical protein
MAKLPWYYFAKALERAQPSFARLNIAMDDKKLPRRGGSLSLVNWTGLAAQFHA